MYQISELAQQLGISRTTLLYYEKIGLISAKRQANGYRIYSNQDLQRLKLFQQLQAGGLTLKECKASLEDRIDRPLLLQRLQALDNEIAEKQKARELLASLLGASSMRRWHESMENQAPDAHFTWLTNQGFTEKQALRLKWLSKDMNEHDRYMEEFESIFDGLDRLGPGFSEDTLRAFEILRPAPQKILEIGCGRGVATTVLAARSQGQIYALDNDETNLGYVRNAIFAAGLDERVTPLCASMTDLPFDKNGFDAIWSEGSAYIMGFRKALSYWRDYIKPDGFLVVSDLVWLTEERSQEALEFWHTAYPAMSTVQDHLLALEASGYKLLETFELSRKAWVNYLWPLHSRIANISDDQFLSGALTDLTKEIAIHEKYAGEYGYQMFALQRSS